MKKVIFLLSFLCLNSFVFAQSVKISTNTANTIEAGKPNKIEVAVAKGKISGIARLQLELPKGLKAMEGNNKEALFSFSKQIVQILWIQLPNDSIIYADFLIVPGLNYSGNAEISGRFSFIINDKKEEVKMQPIQLNISGTGEKSFEKYKAPKENTVLPQKQASTQPKPKENIPESKTKSSPEIKKSPVAEKTTPAKKETKLANKAEVNKKEEIKTSSPKINNAIEPKKNNITFKIQLAASTSELDKKQLSSQFSYPIEQIKEEQINNMYKYTTGEFLTFKEAKKAMTLNETLKGKAFIVGYKDGKRIDLEEAIQLSK